MLKPLLFSLLLSSAAATAAPLWLRFPALSPDGKTIAFCYQGDIYTVPSAGGEARPLTTNAAYDCLPVWSPDGKTIAFASDREGSLDVFVTSREGGTPRRLTTHSGSERPMAFLGDSTVLFQAALRPTAESSIFADATFPQVYQVSTSGGRPRLFSTLPLCDVSVRGDGAMLYHDQKGYENQYRKHHTSSVARDIWLLSGGRHTRLTDFPGEDRTPRWQADGRGFYYLSEQDGTFNVWHAAADGTTKTQITHHKGNPVRSLSVACDGLLCYSYDGELYTTRTGQQPKRVNISIAADAQSPALERWTRRSGAQNIAVSPSGKEIAFIMHGDVYVTSSDYETTRRITDTPEQERRVGFAPDGRTLVYDSERNGLWQLYTTTIARKDEPQFAYATELTEKRLTENGDICQQPAFSPDGKSVAFYRNRTELAAIDIATRKERTLMPGAMAYSYSDGDLSFEWSPDSRWLLATYMGHGGWNAADIALVSADGSGRVTNLTQSGYNEGSARWALGGKAMLFESDREGYRSHGSWGSEGDAYLMFFSEEAYERFLLTKEEKERLAEAEKDKKDNTDDTGNKNSKNKYKNKNNATPPPCSPRQRRVSPKSSRPRATGKARRLPPSVTALSLDTLRCRDRIVRLTPNSSHMGDMLASITGDTLYYETRFEGGYDLWRHDRREGKTERVLKGVSGALVTDKAMKSIFVAGASGIQKIDFKAATQKAVTFAADFNYRPYQEREYLFNHVWRQVRDKFYRPTLHDAPWDTLRQTYQRFLPYVANNYDFADLLSEMLGELNASHTGSGYRAPGAKLQTASLGLFFDDTYTGPGLRVAEVIEGSPLSLKQKNVTAGTIIEAIDGHRLAPGDDYFPYLDGKAGKPLRLTIRATKATKSEEITTKPIKAAEETDLLYRRWVRRNERLVDSLSHGQVAYVHVRAMDSESFREVYRELLSEKNRVRKAVIVDERHNGGGWLHDDLCTLLSGREYQQFVPRGQYIGSDPYNKWTKPSCVLVCENDYSNGHGFPWVYKTLGIGPLIGAPVPGTMTAVWWETLQDASLFFGIPEVGCRSMDGQYGENRQLEPDITVLNTPDDYTRGRDRQLERAVEAMLEKAAATK